ncbi:MAG: hypothetical protein JO252_01450 [Planctomycetaceae bacterium]|nr:hypothetical protein [Planctomycetaceae bacterium]
MKAMPQDHSSFYQTQPRIDGWRIAVCSLICAAAWPWLCASAGAAVILDQSYSFATANSSFSLSNGVGFRTVQTFAVRHEGQLVQVDVDGNIFGKVSMHILDTLHGAPESVISTGVWTGSTDGFNQFSVAPIKVVTAGEELGFEVVGLGNAFDGELSGNDTNAFDANPAYGGGAVYFVNPGAGVDSFRIIPGGDTYFRTYVNTTPAPEPSSALMLLVGLAGLAFATIYSRSSPLSWATSRRTT